MTTPIKLMSRKQLEAQIRDAKNELNARRKANATPEDMNATIRAYQQAQGREDGDEWEQPVSALDSYLKGAEVSHDGKRWLSTLDNNVWEPPNGWRLKAETDEDGNEVPPPYVSPSGSHDSYQQGEKITWSDGKVYRAVRSGVAHSPEEYPPDWELVEPEDGEGGEDVDPIDPEVPEDDVPDYVQPSSAEDAYHTGDRVRWQGDIYESVIDNNVWSPTDHPSGWDKVV